MDKDSIFFHGLILAFMLLSLFLAPVEFIGNNISKGLQWILIFVFCLIFLLWKSLKEADSDKEISDIKAKAQEHLNEYNEHRYYYTWVEAANNRRKGDRIYYDPYVRLYYLVTVKKRSYWGI